MTITLLLISLASLILTIIIGSCIKKMFDFNKANGVCNSDLGAFSYMFWLFSFAGGFFLCLAVVNKGLEGPKAIDVYRNKTELRITSINGVPTDTVVVWKGEVYEDIQ